jgi:protein involved in polysaccharide export with SLBB domain
MAHLPIRLPGASLVSFIALWAGTIFCGCTQSNDELSPRESALARIERSKFSSTNDSKQTSEDESFSSSTTSPPRWLNKGTNIIASGNKIKIESGQDAKITGEYQVDSSGRLALPYGVTISASSKSISTLRSDLARAYREYLVNPVITASIVSSDVYVSVKGLVAKPGNVLVSSTATIDEVIANAGGLLTGKGDTPLAKYATITQGSLSHTIHLSDYYQASAGTSEVQSNTEDYGSITPRWSGIESVFFQSEFKGSGRKKGSASSSIKLLGQVENPGEYPYISGADFFYYLIKAGGPTVNANLTNLVVLRPLSQGTKSVSFSLEEGSTPPTLKPGDTIMVYPESPSSLEKQSRVVSGFGGVLSAIAAAILAAFAF